MPGGGVALINAVSALDSVDLDDADAATGARILRRALEEPMRMIANNAGLDGAVVIEKVRGLHEDGKANTGYDVIQNDYVDMLDAGPVRPCQGHPQRGREREFDCGDDPDDGGADHGYSRGREADARRRPRHGRHGRLDVGVVVFVN